MTTEHAKCEGYPGWACGRALSGRERWCIVHGDAADRSARWNQYISPTPRTPDGITPVASQRELVAALQGELL